MKTKIKTCPKCGGKYKLIEIQKPIKTDEYGMVTTYINHYTIVDMLHPEKTKSGVAVNHC